MSSRGSPPAVQGDDQRTSQVPAAGIGPAADQGIPGEPGGGQQPGMVAGQHRHGARAGAAHRDHDPPDRRATSLPRTSRRSERISPARRPGRPAPPRASAAPSWAARPPGRGSRRSPPGRRLLAPLPSARPGWKHRAMSTMGVRLARVPPRSLTTSLRTAGSGSRPTSTRVRCDRRRRAQRADREDPQAGPAARIRDVRPCRAGCGGT